MNLVIVSASKWPTVRRDYGLALLSAFLLILSFPNFGIYQLAWIALVPLLSGLEGKSHRQAFALSFVTGISFLMGVFYWINVIDGFTLSDFLLLGLVLGSYYGLFGFLLNVTSRSLPIPRAYTAPCLWVTMEYCRVQLGAFSLPWVFIGHTQYLNLAVIQIASVTGVYGVSFLIVMINAALSDVLLQQFGNNFGATLIDRRGVWVAVLVTAGLFSSSIIYGLNALAKPVRGNVLKVAVIQANIPQNVRWNPRLQEQHLAKHIELTHAALRLDKPDILVWPETSVRGSVSQNRNLRERLGSLAKDSKAFLMIGSAEQPKFNKSGLQSDKLWNSAFLISPAGDLVGRYDKIRLFPFGEYLPYKRLPWPSRIASAWNTHGYEAGSKFTIFEIAGNKLAVTICWENIFPNLVREFVKGGARLIVNMTNEAWFGETAAPYQLLSMSVFRAVENHVAVVRAGNTGVSGVIDPFGRIKGTVQNGHKELFVEGYLTKDVAMLSESTFYTLHGDVFLLGCVGFYLIVITPTFLRRIQRLWRASGAIND